MTAYVITGNCNIRQLGTLSPSGSATARSGGDTVDTNGFSFTIDQDTRYGLTGTTSTSFGNMTVNATKGGSVNIDARYVRMIPFTGGSGTITAGSTITVGSATGVVIGLYSSLTAAPVLTGVATGWIKVTAWNSVAFPTSGAFTQAGFTFTVSGASIVGFIEVVGDEAGTINANRLGTVNVLGEWFDLGTTSGAAGQTFQIPTNGQLKHIAGVYIERTAGQQDYEFYPNAGTVVFTGTVVGIANDQYRGKVCWITTAGLVTLGNGGGTGLNGFVPAAGLDVVVPNIHLENCTTAARTANATPNATLATRYDFTTTGGGVVVADKANFGWYPSFAQAYSVTLSNIGVIDAILASEVATAMTWTKVGVGNKPTTALLTNALTLSLCFAGGTFTDCVWQRVSQAASGAHTTLITDVAGFSFVRNTFRANTIRGNATAFSMVATRAVNCSFSNSLMVQGAISLVTCNGITGTNPTYVDCVSGTTVTTYAMYVWQMSSNTLNCTFSGLTLPVLNCQPYTAILQIDAAGCSNIKLRNIGTYAAPLSLGTVNNTGLVFALAAGAAATDIKVQRVYVSSTRTGLMTGDNSSTRVTAENLFGDFADAADVAAVLNYARKGIGGTLAVTAQTAVYGTHWADNFTSATAGRLTLLMNEPTSLTTSQVSLTGGAAFTSAGGLYMPNVGQTATFETPYFIKGHLTFSATAGTMAGGTVGNYRFEYSIDKNDGNGWSAMTAASYTAATLATAMNAITGINASLGFKLRLKITTSTANTTAITSMFLVTTSSAVAQAYQYPLEVVTLTLTGLVSGSDVVVLQAGTSTVLDSVDAVAGTTWGYTYETLQNVDIGIIKPGLVPLYIRNYALGSADATLPISQTFDRNYGA